MNADDRKLLEDVLDWIDSERLPDPTNAHPNDRDRFEERCKEHPDLIARIKACLAEPVEVNPDTGGPVSWEQKARDAQAQFIAAKRQVKELGTALTAANEKSAGQSRLLKRLLALIDHDTYDCIDNSGQPYQSQALADAIIDARAALDPATEGR